ncbi:MAG: nucleotidyltransferase domain-containing protein [Defluviitaleaceae bacterium]|nr:nucleotidyltransferase domain-containing protein [Defluviitaleaceae bacterium]MCL2264059.1 nucleotidyltransferase domain-containing protein [Defluviitaleaceae bacterium]
MEKAIIPPKLTVNILVNILSDAIKLYPHIVAVGLVGSFARNEQRANSDVDILLKLNNEGKFQDALETFGEYVRQVLDYQFNKRVDIVRYDRACDCSTREPKPNEVWFCRESFAQMLREVVWLYER